MDSFLWSYLLLWLLSIVTASTKFLRITLQNLLMHNQFYSLICLSRFFSRVAFQLNYFHDSPTKFECAWSSLLFRSFQLHLRLPNDAVKEGQLLFSSKHYRIALLEISSESDLPLQLPSFGSLTQTMVTRYLWNLMARHGRILWVDGLDYLGRNYSMFLSCDLPPVIIIKYHVPIMYYYFIVQFTQWFLFDAEWHWRRGDWPWWQCHWDGIC
jgi:hypothetical protein